MLFKDFVLDKHLKHPFCEVRISFRANGLFGDLLCFMRQDTTTNIPFNASRYCVGYHMNMKSHLDISGETWVFSPYLAREALRQLLKLFSKLKPTSASLYKKFSSSKQRRQLNNLIPELQPLVIVGNASENLKNEINSIGTNGRRQVLFSATAPIVNPHSFVLYLSLPTRLGARELGDMAAFALNPLRPDLLNAITNALARETNHEFLISDQWYHVGNNKRWISADKLKLHLASLHKPAYLVSRLKVG